MGVYAVSGRGRLRLTARDRAGVCAGPSEVHAWRTEHETTAHFPSRRVCSR